jgi:GH18 family chitinase
MAASYMYANSLCHIASVQYGLPNLIKLAHAAGTKVLVSVGGWSGSVAFSGMASSSANRAQFIQWNVNFIQQYGTDGVDLGMHCEVLCCMS